MKMAPSKVWLVSGRTAGCIAAACLVFLSALSAQAAPLAVGGFLSPVPVEADPAPPSTQIDTVSVPFAGLGFSGVLVSEVFRGNQFGNDTLTFTYQLSNDAASVNALHRITVSSFESFLTDVSTQTGGVLPTLSDRSTPDVVGFSFLSGLGQGPVRPGAGSSLLVVETNSIEYTPSTAAIIDGTTATAATFAPLPAIPEPATCLLAAVGLLGLIGMVRRVRR